MGFPGGLAVKNLPINVGDKRDMGSIPGSGISFGEIHGKSPQYFCLDNSMDRGAYGLQSIGLQRVDTTEQLRTHTYRVKYNV